MFHGEAQSQHLYHRSGRSRGNMTEDNGWCPIVAFSDDNPLAHFLKEPAPVDLSSRARPRTESSAPFVAPARIGEVECSGRQHAVNGAAAQDAAGDQQVTNEFVTLTAQAVDVKLDPVFWARNGVPSVAQRPEDHRRPHRSVDLPYENFAFRYAPKKSSNNL